MAVPASTCALVLAAGKGTRMATSLPKVMNPILDQPMLFYPLLEVNSSGISDIAVIVGSGGATITEYLENRWPDTNTIWQHEQKGTGHAVMVAEEWWSGYDQVLVLPGDVPLIDSSTIEQLLLHHAAEGAAASFISFSPADPRGYGRVISNSDGIYIVEEKDATDTEKLTGEVNSGIYIFQTTLLTRILSGLSNNNSQGEYYLTDSIKMIQETGSTISTMKIQDPDQCKGVNTLAQLSDANELMRNRINYKWISKGVRMMEPRTVHIGPQVTLSRDVEIEPFVHLTGRTFIDRGVKVSSFSVISNSSIGQDTEILPHSMVMDSFIERGARIGPFSFIRDDSRIAEDAFIGKFVEVKKSQIGRGTKVPHLSYIGDAVIGKDTNIGAGTITCNYDGQKKHRTVIGDRCFIGSDTMLVAPVNVEDDSFTGAGSVITRDIPSGSLAVARARQKNLKDWVRRKKTD